MMSPVYRARAVQPGTAMTAHGDQVRCHCGAGPFFASGAPSDQRPGDADPALKQIYLCVTQPTANSEEAICMCNDLIAWLTAKRRFAYCRLKQIIDSFSSHQVCYQIRKVTDCQTRPLCRLS